MMTLVSKNEGLRSLSQIFTPSNFRKIVKKSDSEILKYRIEKYVKNYSSYNLLAVLKFLYKQLETGYRNEYIYKNALLNQKLLKEYGLEDTTVLNEFKIGSSISDFILLNGDIRVFEIKTDLDAFSKLEKQIEDYQKFANKVYVVISSKNKDKILERFNDSPVGVVEFSENNVLTNLKEAVNYTKKFDHITIFKALRQAEYFQIIKDYYGRLPEVPNTRMFRECLELVKGIDIIYFQSQARIKLKQREIKCPDLLQSAKTPLELKHICYTLNLSNSEYETLYDFLNSTI